MYYLIGIAIVIAIILIIIYKIYDLHNTSLIKSVSNNLESTEMTNGPSIPKIIIQTWKTNTVPQRYMTLIDSVKA